jgi:hypothetical protein
MERTRPKATTELGVVRLEEPDDLAVLREAPPDLLREEEVAVDQDVELPPPTGCRDRIDVQ